MAKNEVGGDRAGVRTEVVPIKARHDCRCDHNHCILITVVSYNLCQKI